MSQVLEVSGLAKSYRQSPLSRDRVDAIRDVSFAIESGESVGLVGRSGCGKSTIARCVLQLLRPDAGSVVFDGRDLCGLGGRALRRRRLGMQAVFQDPMGSFDPRYTILASVCESLQWAGVPAIERRQRAEEAIGFVGLAGLEERRPHQLSGGQVQRAALARAIAVRPKLIVLDEATSALDLSIQAQVLNLLRDLQERIGVATLVISHDFGVINVVCRRVLVMDEGTIVEEGPTREVLARPVSDIGRQLLDAALASERATRAPA